MRWASRASAPKVWLSESDSEEEEEEVDLGDDENFDVELLAKDIDKKDEVVEEEIEEEVSSVEYGNFARDVIYEQDEMASVSEDSCKDMPEGESVCSADFWDSSDEGSVGCSESESSSVDSGIGVKIHVDYAKLEVKGIASKSPDMEDRVLARLMRSVRVLRKKKLRNMGKRLDIYIRKERTRCKA